MSGLTRVEADYCEQVPYELRRIADSLKKLVDSKEKQTGKTEVSVDVPMKDAHPLDSPFDVLAVTDVKVYVFNESSNMDQVKGLATIVLNDQLQIRGLRVMEGINGMYVAYPNDPFYKGEELRAGVFPMTKQLCEHIENCVLEKYMEATK